jgi:dinuclear metal center YbgI/SA1388 family protein
MDKYEIVKRIETLAPLDSAEKWDCSGWLVETNIKNVNKILLALTVTDDIYNQAIENHCDMIVSHHPLFKVPLKYKDIDIYCAHTNLDLADGGTTDTLIERFRQFGLPVKNLIRDGGFVRYVETDITKDKLCKIIAKISPNFRFTNKGVSVFKKLGFCAGSGTEFIEEAKDNGADGFVTGDLKFHTALDSSITVFDIGHFESEIQVLEVFKTLIANDVAVVFAKEKSPFETFVV